MKIKIFLIILSAVFLYQSCSIISFTRSSIDDIDSKGIAVSDDCKLTSTGVVYMNMAGIVKTEFFPSSFKIEYKDKLIYIDPVVVDDTSKADFIFITHVHNDHFSKTDIEKLSDSETIIIAPESVTKKLKMYKTKTVSIGENLEFEDIKCEAVYAYNMQKAFMGMILHPKGNDNVGYIISLGTVRIYHAGDTDLIPEMKNLRDITIALMPIGEGNTAMNPQSAAEATNMINPSIVIPVHYEIGNNKFKEFSKLIKKDILIYSLRKLK